MAEEKDNRAVKRPHDNIEEDGEPNNRNEAVRSC